jgi:hypothetical protein
MISFANVDILFIKNIFGIYTISIITYLTTVVFVQGENCPYLECLGHSLIISVLHYVLSKTNLIMESNNNDSINELYPFLIIALFLGIFLFGIAVGRTINIQQNTKSHATFEENKRKLKLRGKQQVTDTNTASPMSTPTHNIQLNSESHFNGDLPPALDLSMNNQTQTSQSSTPKNSDFLNLIKGSHVQASTSNESVLDPSGIMFIPSSTYTTLQYDSIIETSKETLKSIIGLPNCNYSYANRQWTLVRSATSTHIWVSKKKEDGVLIRGTAFAPAQAKSVLRWIVEEDLVTGMEGISHRREVIATYNGGSVVVRRIIFKSGSLTSSKRDFLIVTNTSVLPDGTFIVVSRSIDIPEKLTRNQRKQQKNGYIRGVVYASGYVIRPLASSKESSSNNSGCEIFFAAHLDMLGSFSGRMNTAKTDILAGSIITIMNRIQQTCTDTIINSVPTSTSPIVSIPSILPPYTPFVVEKEQNNTIVDDSNEFQTMEEEHPQIGLTTEQNRELLLRARGAITKIRKLHSSIVNQDKDIENHVRERSQSSGLRPMNDSDELTNQVNVSWNNFYDQDGVRVSELTDPTAPMGILTSFVSTSAPPSVVRTLLLEQPDVIDSLLVGRSILNHVSDKTYVQWLGYGAIWPVGARDFLIVTTEEAYNTEKDEGFIIVSTSVDDICEEVDEEENDDKSASKFTRSSLRVAGYVGVLNAEGGTDLRCFVDIDVYDFVPAWLLQVLCQYGLSEMMTRIRRNTSGEPNPKEPFELTKMINQIQEREMKRNRINSDLDESTYLPPSTLPSTPTKTSHKVLENDSTNNKSINNEENSTDNNDGQYINLDNQVSVPIDDTATLSPGDLVIDKLKKESLIIYKTYIGLLDDKGKLGLDWRIASQKNTISISSSSCAGSSWGVIKGTIVIKALAREIMSLLLNDDRIKEYDDMFDSYTVSIYYYYYYYYYYKFI